MAKQNTEDQSPENPNDDGGEIENSASQTSETKEKDVPEKPTQLFENQNSIDTRERLAEQFEERENLSGESETDEGSQEAKDPPPDESADDKSGRKPETRIIKSMGGEREYTVDEMVKIVEQHEGLEAFNRKLDAVKQELKETNERIAESQKPPEEEQQETEQPKAIDTVEIAKRISTGTHEEAGAAVEELIQTVRDEVKRESEDNAGETLTTEDVEKRVAEKLQQREMVAVAADDADKVMGEFLARDEKKNMDLFANEETMKIFSEETQKSVVPELLKLGFTEDSLRGYSTKQLVEGHQLNQKHHPKGKDMRPLDDIFEEAAGHSRKRIEIITGRPAVTTSNISDKKSEKSNISTQPDRQSSPPPKSDEDNEPKTEAEYNEKARKELIAERQEGWKSLKERQ